MNYFRPIILSFVIIGISSFCWELDAQTNREQQLLQRLDSLKITRADTALVQTYFNLAHFYLRQDSAKTSFYANRALHAADSIDSQLGRGIGHMTIGLHEIIQGNYTNGLKHTYDAESFFKELNRDDYLAMVYSYLGIAYSRIGNNNRALRYYLRSDSLMKQTGSLMQQAQIKANIGILYSSQGYHESSIRYFKEAMPIIQQYGSPAHVALGYHNIGVAYRHLAEHDSALVYLSKAKELRKGSNDRFGLASSIQNIGKVYHELGQSNLALDYISEAIELQKALGDQGILLTSYLDAAKIYRSLNNNRQAKENALNSLEIAERIGVLNYQAEALALLSEIEEEAGNISDAFQYLKRYRQLQDSLLDQNQSKAFEEMRARYETQELERQVELLQQKQALSEAELFNSRVLRNSLIGGFIALLIILVLLLTRYRAGKKYQTELKHKNKKLEELSEEKSEYLHIAAHDLKSPLSSILGLAEIMKDSEMSAEEAQEHAEFIYISAFRMHDLIKQFLDVNAIESGKKLAEIQQVDLTHIIHQVIEHYKYRAKWKDIKLKPDLQEDLTAMADPLLFREVLDNLVSNSIKYSKKNTNVQIRGRYQNQQVRVEVEDEGPGLSEEDQQNLFKKFKRLTPEPTEGEGSTGLGLYITKKMVDAMDGEIWCESDGSNGSTFLVELPKSV